MTRSDRLALRLSEEERHLLNGLAARLQRSPGDTVRLLIHEFARSFAEHEQKARSLDCAHPTWGLPASRDLQEEI